MDQTARMLERAVATRPEDAAAHARLATAHARSGDLAAAHPAAIAALSLDPRQPVRDLLPAPPAPRGNLLQVREAAPRPGPRPPVQIRELAGPAMTGCSIVDLGRGAAAYATAAGLACVDVFGLGIVWIGKQAAPWGIHAGRLIATSASDAQPGLHQLEPSTGAALGAPLRPRDLGMGDVPAMRLVALDDRRLAVLGSPGASGITPTILNLADGQVTRRPDLPPIGSVEGVTGASGTFAYAQAKPADIFFNHIGNGQIVGLCADGRSWEIRADLLGAIGPWIATRDMPDERLAGAALRLRDPTSGAIVQEAPQRTSITRGIHVFPDMLVTVDGHGRLFGLDRRTWERRWSWGPAEQADDISLVGFADQIVVVFESHHGSAPGPPRSAYALLSLDLRTGQELWRLSLDLGRHVQLAGEPMSLAVHIALPAWNARPRLVGP